MDDTKLPLTDHLSELRSRLFRIVIAWGVGALAAWNFCLLYTSDAADE